MINQQRAMKEKCQRLKKDNAQEPVNETKASVTNDVPVEVEEPTDSKSMTVTEEASDAILNSEQKNEELEMKGEAENVSIVEPESKDSATISTGNEESKVSNAVYSETEVYNPSSTEVDGNLNVTSNYQDNSSPSPVDGEKQQVVENGNEGSKKLSASAPPFSPSSITAFGSVSVPAFKDHGGILPPPVIVPPMLTPSPARRSPHQSAMARVPYGPRLSGGFNRSGSRVPWGKPVFHNGEDTGDVNHFSPPRIMNPHAAEFVPGQPWVSNGYLVPPNGYMAAPNGYTIVQNGVAVSQNDDPAATVNGVLPVVQNRFTPVGSPEANAPEHVEPTSDDKNECVEEEGGKEPSTVVGSTLTIEEEKDGNPKEVNSESSLPENEEKHVDIVIAPCINAVEDKHDNKLEAEGTPGKRWGDYSDSEPEVIEVVS